MILLKAPGAAAGLGWGSQGERRSPVGLNPAPSLSAPAGAQRGCAFSWPGGSALARPVLLQNQPKFLYKSVAPAGPGAPALAARLGGGAGLAWGRAGTARTPAASGPRPHGACLVLPHLRAAGAPACRAHLAPGKGQRCPGRGRIQGQGPERGCVGGKQGRERWATSASCRPSSPSVQASRPLSPHSAASAKCSRATPTPSSSTPALPLSSPKLGQE